jgi:hypothetical protein
MMYAALALAVTVGVAALAGYGIRRYRLAGRRPELKYRPGVQLVEYDGRTYAVSFPEPRRGSRYDTHGLTFVTEPKETD